jgi:hypothetical protein
MSDAKQKSIPEPITGKVRFDYIKSNFFRVIHVDGVHGGLRPSGTAIHMALFSERNAIPQTEEMQITEGRIVSPIKVEGRHAIVREVEVDAIVDLGTAVALRDWLSNMIGIMESINKKEG